MKLKVLVSFLGIVLWAGSALAITWPVDTGTFPKDLNSDFGPRDVPPPASAMHDGIDLPAKDGTFVKAATGGKVFSFGERTGYGISVVIQSGDLYYLYGHLYDPKDENTPAECKKLTFNKNDEIKEGQNIGCADHTGNAPRPHLHLTVAKNLDISGQEKINPLKEFTYTATPPTITKVEVKDGEGKALAKNGDKYVLQKKTLLRIEATVEDTEKDLNEVSFSATSSPPMSYTFTYPTKGFSDYKLNNGILSKQGLPIKVKPGNVEGQDKSTDLFTLEWSLANVEAKDFGVTIAAKDVKDKSTQESIGFTWSAVASIGDFKVLDAEGKPIEIATKSQPTVEVKLVPEGGVGSFIPQQPGWSSRLMFASTPQVINPEITYSADGKEASYRYTATGLEDGMHTATVEVLDNDGQATDSKQKLFMVDTTPPVILKDKLEDIVTRTGLVFLPMALLEPGTYFYAIPFKEEGSGVAKIEVLEAGGVRQIEDQFIHRSGASPDFNLAVNEEPFGSRTLTVRIYDQAGNVGEKTFSFKSSKALISREIGNDPLEGSKKIRQYCYATRYGGTYDPAPSSFYITSGRVGDGGIDMNTPLYIRTNKHTTAHSASSYLAVTLNGVDGQTGWKTWKVTQTKPASGSRDPGFVQLVGPLYIDFTIMEKDMSIIGVEPGPSVTVEFVLGFELAALRAGLGYNSEANALDARWENRQAQDLVFVLNLDGSDVLPTEITADALRYAPIAEGSHQAVLAIYDRILNGWGKLERGFSVNLGEPRIADFAYITEDGVFKAQITDKGTTLRDLDLEFYLNGEKSLFEFDKKTGTLIGLLYDPPEQGTVTAQLFVTDKAGNRVSSLAKAYFYTPSEGTATGVSGSITPADVKIGEAVKITEDNCTTTYQRSDQCWVTVTKECTWYNMFGGFDRLDPPTAKNLPKTEGNKLPNIPEITTTTTKRVDLCPPVISDLRYDAASRTVQARISDPNTPLAVLRIEYGGSAILGNQWYDLRHPHFDFSTGTGEFVGDLPGEETEIYAIRLSVDDRHNKTYGNLSIRVPRKPPEVNLYFNEFSGSANRDFLNALGLEHLLVGEYSDASGIDDSRTELEIDGVIKRNYITYPLGQISRQLIYRADLAEGRHQTRLRVADTLGLESETYLVFDIAYKPHIQRFTYQGTVKGVPVFVAFIKDQGYDVTLQGITLLLDGKEISRDQCFYNSETGFFSVPGPLDIAAGAHQARLTAIDSQGNRAEEILSFGGPVAEEVLAQAVGGVRITGYSAWDVQGNGDGRINPGERVRLFVEVLSDFDIAHAQGRLRTTHPSITMERDEAEYGDIPKGQRTESIGAFELVIKDDFFSNTNSQQEAVACYLTLTDQAGKEWVLPFRITVYRTPELFREAQGPAVASSISLEIIQPQNGVEYWVDPPVTVEGRFTVTGSTLTFIMALLESDLWWIDPILIPLSENPAAGTFSGPLRSLRGYWPRGGYTLTVGAENSAGDRALEIIRFSIDKVE